jgi:hypothetical protein
MMILDEMERKWEGVGANGNKWPQRAAKGSERQQMGAMGRNWGNEGIRGIEKERDSRVYREYVVISQRNVFNFHR